MDQTDIQFKNDLRKELIMFKDFLKFIDKNDIDGLKEKINDEIERINATLQD
jgi:hypothetical protein